MNVAIFDSGIGGLTVLKEAYKLLPDENYIYYADTKNVPYGTKSKEEVKKLIMHSVDFLSALDIKILVIACNTATSVAISDLRKKYSFPIIGMEPAVKPAIEHSLDKKILVLATTLTLKEEKLKNLITSLDKKNIVDKLSLDKLVIYAENFQFYSQEIIDYIRERLNTVNLDDYGTIVLGCTHFIFFKSIIEDIISSNIKIIDGNEGTVRNMKNILEKNSMLNYGRGGKISFYSSGIRDDESREIKLKKLLSD